MNIKKAAKETLTLAINDSRATWSENPALSKPHIKRICLAIIDGEVEGDKAHRWLGWAQCAVVGAGICSLDQMKEINKSSTVGTPE